MDRHIQILLNRLSCVSFTIGTIILLFLILQIPETCIPSGSNPKPHQKFPKSTCDFTPRPITTLEKKNKKLWSTKAWKITVESFAAFFHHLQSLKALNNHSKVLCVSAGAGHEVMALKLNNHSKVLCVSAGAGHEVMALKQMGVKDVTGVELIDSAPLVSRADPHNLPFFDKVFDLSFSAHFDQALFPSRFAAEMERTVRGGGFCVVAVEECGKGEVVEITELFRRSRFFSAENVTLTGSKMTTILLRVKSY